MLNPRNALNSDLSFPIYQTFLDTSLIKRMHYSISHIRCGEKYKSKTSTGSEKISSTGSVGEVNGWIGMCFVVHVELEGPAEPEEPEPGT